MTINDSRSHGKSQYGNKWRQNVALDREKPLYPLVNTLLSLRGDPPLANLPVGYPHIVHKCTLAIGQCYSVEVSASLSYGKVIQYCNKLIFLVLYTDTLLWIVVKKEKNG